MSSPTAIPETGQIQQQGTDLVARAHGLVVVNQATLDTGGHLVKSIRELRRQVKETFADPKAKSHAAHRAVCDAEKKHDAPLAAAEMTIKNSISGYLREEEQRRQNELITRQAEERRKEEQARLERAALLDEAGEKDAADALLDEEPPPPPPPTTQDMRPQADGITSRKTWAAEVTNLRALAKYVADGGAVNLLLPNMPALNSMARSHKEEMRVPGVSAISTIGVAGR